MQLFIIIAFCLALVIAMPRVQRDTQWLTNDHNAGVLGIKHTGTLYDGKNLQVAGTGMAMKDFNRHHDSTAVGAGLDLTYADKTKFGVNAVNTGRFGTDVNAEASYTFHKTPNSQWDIGANAQQHFGGPFGNSRPDYGGFIRGSYKF